MIKSFTLSALVLIIFSSLQLRAEVNPFAQFQGKYTSLSCNCIGQGIDELTYDPCLLQAIEVRPAETVNKDKIWVLDEVTFTHYTVRPLDELSMKTMQTANENVATQLSGGPNLASVTFTSNLTGVSTYRISKVATGLQYASGGKGKGRSGAVVNLQCYHSLVKK